QSLHLFEDRRPLLGVKLVGLQREKLVDVGIAPIDVGAAVDDERGEPRRGVAECTARRAEYPRGELLVGVSRSKSGTLHRHQLAADADLLQIIYRDFTNIGIRAVDGKRSGVETTGKAGCGEQ